MGLAGTAISVKSNAGGMMSGVINNNSSNGFVNGVFISSALGSSFDLTVAGNTIINNDSGDSIVVNMEGSVDG